MICDEICAIALHLRTFPGDTIINKRGIYLWYNKDEKKYFWHNPKTGKSGEARGLRDAERRYKFLLNKEIN